MIPMRHRPVQFFFAGQIFLCGFLFFVADMIGLNSMPLAVYGAAAYDIDAEVWALGFMSAPLMVMVGVLINGRRRWSPIPRASGWLMLLLMSSYLGVSAWSSDAGAHVTIYALVMVAPASALFLGVNMADLIVRLRRDPR
jgi:hypothetical protein